MASRIEKKVVRVFTRPQNSRKLKQWLLLNKVNTNACASSFDSVTTFLKLAELGKVDSIYAWSLGDLSPVAEDCALRFLEFCKYCNIYIVAADLANTDKMVVEDMASTILNATCIFNNQARGSAGAANVNEVVRFYKNGLNVREIADIMRLSTRRVSYIIRSAVEDKAIQYHSILRGFKNRTGRATLAANVQKLQKEWQKKQGIKELKDIMAYRKEIARRRKALEERKKKNKNPSIIN